MMAEKSFRDYGHEERRNYITLSSGEFYPDILEQACLLYEPVLQSFRRMLEISASSTELFMNIAAERSSWMRVQLCRVFKRYVSPETPVELLKKKNAGGAHLPRFRSGLPCNTGSASEIRLQTIA